MYVLKYSQDMAVAIWDFVFRFLLFWGDAHPLLDIPHPDRLTPQGTTRLDVPVEHRRTQ